MASKLDELKKLTTVVSDTGEFAEIKKYHPTDATTNPSLIFTASGMPEFAPLVQEAIAWGKKQNLPPERLKPLLLDKIFVNFGLKSSSSSQAGSLQR